MGRSTRRRPTAPRRATFAAFALIVGGGGLVAVNVYASATEGGSDAGQPTTRSAMSGTIDCPDVGGRLTQVPDQARPDVDRQLALLDQQTAQAYQRLQSATPDQRQDSGFTDNAVMTPLKEKRTATIGRITDAIGRAGDRPQGLDALANCSLRTWSEQNGGPGAGHSPQGGQDQGQGGQQSGNAGQSGNGGQAGNGPVAADYQDIGTVQPNAPAPDLNAFVSKGTFTTSCGVNANGLRNSDNVIVAPGVTNGAHHFHDYVGNQSNTAFASDDVLAKADTSCENQGDRSTYYWPVLRLQNGTQDKDANAPGGGIEGNAGQIVTPRQVTMTFIGSPRGQVTDMPRLLRIITGDAKAFVNGPANANASWSCTGFEDRQLKDKYPLCPRGSDVVRTFRFQSCWDGRNIDSANHRTHVAFADASGNCPGGFKAIPQLVQRIVYDVKAPSLQDGGRTTPLFAVDSFPEQLHKPVTDHGDFINVFDDKLMTEMVSCINGGRQCGSGTNEDPGGAGGATQQPSGQPTEQPSGQPSGQPGGQPSQEPTAQPTETATTPPAGNGNGDHHTQPATTAPQTRQASDEPTISSTTQPKVYAKRSASPSAMPAPANGGTNTGDSSAQPQAQATGGGNDPVAAAQTQPQAVQDGNLAKTGTNLWPAAAGTVLLIAGLILLTRSKRRILR